MNIKSNLFLVLSVLLLLSCVNSRKERKLAGKWVLVETAVSTDGGIHFNRYPAEDDKEVLILLDNGVALYPDGILGARLDSATWRVYSNGDSLEVYDEKHKFTGKHDNYRITKFGTSIRDGVSSEMMELSQTGENHSPFFGGASTIILLMRYEKESDWTPVELSRDRHFRYAEPQQTRAFSSTKKEMHSAARPSGNQDERPTANRAEEKTRPTLDEVFQKVANAMHLTSQGLGGINMTDPIGVAVRKVNKDAVPKDYLNYVSWVEWQEQVEWETIEYQLWPSGPIAVKDEET